MGLWWNRGSLRLKVLNRWQKVCCLYRGQSCFVLVFSDLDRRKERREVSSQLYSNPSSAPSIQVQTLSTKHLQVSTSGPQDLIQSVKELTRLNERARHCDPRASQGSTNSMIRTRDVGYPIQVYRGVVV